MDRKPPNLHVISPGAAPNEGELSELAAAVARMKRDQNLIFAFNREQAKIIRNEYDEYVAAGFTAAQAMQLVKAKLAPPAK